MQCARIVKTRFTQGKIFTSTSDDPTISNQHVKAVNTANRVLVIINRYFCLHKIAEILDKASSRILRAKLEAILEESYRVDKKFQQT